MINSITLSELTAKITQVIKGGFSSAVWIRGEISELREKNGHCYLELVEKDKDSDQLIAKSRATIWRSTYAMMKPYFESSTGESLRAGLNILVAVTVEFSGLYGFSLNIKDIDPVFTVGELTARRLQIIKQLEEDGVAEMNKQLTLAELPQRIAVISSVTAAGYGDFMNQLENDKNNFAFYTKLYPAIMQGNNAETSIIQALEKIFEHIDNFDAVVIIRGGGATADLACFDSYNLALNFAQFPLPIISGIGHQRDLSILDLIAHTSVKTPTAAAEFLIDKMLLADNELNSLADRMSRLADTIINKQKMKLENIKYRIKQASKSSYLKDAHTLSSYTLRLKSVCKNFIQKEKSLLKTMEHRIDINSPTRLLEYGYTITTVNGKRLTSINQIKPNAKLTTYLTDGSVKSEVIDK